MHKTRTTPNTQATIHTHRPDGKTPKSPQKTHTQTQTYRPSLSISETYTTREILDAEAGKQEAKIPYLWKVDPRQKLGTHVEVG